jgi:hypothetical protein
VESLPKTHADTVRTLAKRAVMSLLRGGGAFRTSYFVFGQRGDRALTHSTGMGNAGSINQRMKFDKYAQRQPIFIGYYRYDIISSAKLF